MKTFEELKQELVDAFTKWRSIEEAWAQSGGEYNASLREEEAWDNYLTASAKLAEYMENNDD